MATRSPSATAAAKPQETGSGSVPNRLRMTAAKTLAARCGGGDALSGAPSGDLQPELDQPFLRDPKRRSKRSTRPAVSTIFMVPVKNGWLADEISTL